MLSVFRRFVVVATAAAACVSSFGQSFAGADNFNDNVLTVAEGARWSFDAEIAGTGTAFGERNQRIEFTSTQATGEHARRLGWINPSASGAAYARDWTASVVVSNSSAPATGATYAGLEARTETDLGAAGVAHSGYWGVYVSTAAGGAKRLVLEWGRWDPALSGGQGGWVRSSSGRAIADVTDVVVRLAWNATNQTLAASYSFDAGSTFVPAGTFSPSGAEAGLGAPYANGFGLQLAGTVIGSGPVAAGTVYFDDMAVAVDTTTFTAGTPNHAPLALAAGSSIEQVRTVEDSVDGTITETHRLEVLSATAFDIGTYLYTRTGTTTARIEYNVDSSGATYTETERGDQLVTFTSAANGTFTNSGSFSGRTNAGVDYTGTFTSTGTFVYELPANAPVITGQPYGRVLPVGSTARLSISATGSPTFQWRKGDVDLPGATSATLVLNNVQLSDAGAYTVLVRNAAATVLSDTITLVVTTTTGGSLITLQPVSQTASPGSNLSLLTASGEAGASFLWGRDGTSISGAQSPTLALTNLQPGSAGLYAASVAAGGASATTRSAIIGVSASAKITGAAEEVGTDILHPNGNVYDQVLLKGRAASIQADPGQVTRMSFIDLNDDIVQVEFSGPGTLTLVLDAASGPALPVSYQQDIAYMKGHAKIVVTGATEFTNVSVFTVGRATAFDPTSAFNIVEDVSATNDPAANGSPLFQGHDATAYDGIADIAYIAVLSENGRFGGVRTANARYFAARGLTGVYAPDVAFHSAVYVGEITAFDDATATLQLGSGSDVRIAGGSLLQANGRPVNVSGVAQLKFTDGADSHGGKLLAQPNRAQLQQNGVNVTSSIAVTSVP
jgi:hypothetical protein